MGRLATHLAAAVANVDNLQPAKQLPQISLWDAVLPKGYAEAKKQSTDDKKVGEVVLAFVRWT